MLNTSRALPLELSIENKTATGGDGASSRWHSLPNGVLPVHAELLSGPSVESRHGGLAHALHRHAFVPHLGWGSRGVLGGRPAPRSRAQSKHSLGL